MKLFFITFKALLMMFFISGCSIQASDTSLEKVQSQWDFDHHVHFKKIKYDEFNYQIEVIPNNKVSFERLSAFLLRRGYLICGSYGYKLELITGVESFDHFSASPNMITPNLKAKLECPVS